MGDTALEIGIEPELYEELLRQESATGVSVSDQIDRALADFLLTDWEKLKAS